MKDTIDIRNEWSPSTPMKYVLADLTVRGYRLSNNSSEWFIAHKVH